MPCPRNGGPTGVLTVITFGGPAMRGHVAKKGNNYYAVVYEGIDPATGKERRRWHAAGARRIDAERLVSDLVKRRHNGKATTTDRSTLGTYLAERWLPLQETRLRPRTHHSYASVVSLHITPRIGRIRLDKLQPDDLDGLYIDLLRSGNRRGKTASGLSSASVRYLHRVLRKALADAERKGIVPATSRISRTHPARQQTENRQP